MTKPLPSRSHGKPLLLYGSYPYSWQLLNAMWFRAFGYRISKRRWKRQQARLSAEVNFKVGYVKRVAWLDEWTNNVREGKHP